MRSRGSVPHRHPLPTSSAAVPTERCRRPTRCAHRRLPETGGGTPRGKDPPGTRQAEQDGREARRTGGTGRTSPSPPWGPLEDVARTQPLLPCGTGGGPWLVQSQRGSPGGLRCSPAPRRGVSPGPFPPGRGRRSSSTSRPRSPRLGGSGGRNICPALCAAIVPGPVVLFFVVVCLAFHLFFFFSSSFFKAKAARRRPGRKGPAVPASRPQPQETKQPGDKGGRRFLFLPPPSPGRYPSVTPGLLPSTGPGCAPGPAAGSRDPHGQRGHGVTPRGPRGRGQAPGTALKPSLPDALAVFWGSSAGFFFFLYLTPTALG